MLLSRSIRDYTNSDDLISPVLAHVMHHAFLCISLPSLHDYDVKFPNFTFYGGRERRQRPSFCFPEL